MEPGLLKSADWPLLIDLYFFLGGVAGGAFLIATIAHLLDGRRYRDVVRVGYYVAFLAIVPAPLLLIIDLGLPTRFLHMMMVSKPSVAIGMGAATLGPFHFKPLSPMNVGAWALLGFSLFAFLAALDVFLEDRGGRSMVRLRTWVGIIGSLLGFFIAAYPGVLLGATARPLFISAHWLGAFFLAVGASTGAAAIALILALLRRRTDESLVPLMRFTVFALVIQAVFLGVFIISVMATGSAGVRTALRHLIAMPFGPVFWLGVVGLGIVVPLLMRLRGSVRPTVGLITVFAVLVLVGGFLAKYVIIAAGQKLAS
jgi:formate-dependent nitrite reductase membrane component NrfD